MSSRKAESFKWQMMELSDGITTSNGNWYHITSDAINKYVPGLFKKVTLERIIKEADAWVKSADGLSLFVFFLLVYLSVPPLYSAAFSIIFFLFWYFNTSAFIAISATPVMKAMTNDGFVYLASAVLLMGISFNQFLASFGLLVPFQALWYGLGLFFLFKVGLLRLLVKFIQNRTGKQKTEMPDRILNMLLIRYGMKHGILTGNLKKMQDDLIDMANYHKTRNK